MGDAIRISTRSQVDTHLGVFVLAESFHVMNNLEMTWLC
jgi:hypothetical protein